MEIIAFFLHFLCFSQLFFSQALSRIIIQEKIVSFTFQEQSQSFKQGQKIFLKDQNNIKKDNQNSISSHFQSTQYTSQYGQHQKEQKGHKVRIMESGLSQNFNFYSNQRLIPSFSSEFSDEQESIYTNKLSLFSSLGTDIDSKTMEYVKIKVQYNRKKIVEENKSKRRSYQLSQNKFIIYTSEQFKNMFLTLKEPDSTYSKSHPQNLTVIVPQKNLRILQELNINWKTAKKMTSVKYQKQCGACYSFTSLGTIQSAYLIQHSQNLNLAQQQIVDCSAPYGNFGCVGGWTINAYKYIKDFGVVFESDYPFTASEGSCNVPESKPKYKIKGYVQLKNDCNLVIEALKNQPLSIAINAEGWQYYSSGVYTECIQGPSNHGVILAGADSTTWLIKNSWGFTWGEQGYIRISRTAPNQACNVCKWASYPII